MRPRLEEMFEKVLEDLDSENIMNKIPSGVVITGGGSLTNGTVDSAKRVLGLPAKVGYPKHITGLIDEVKYPQYASLVGMLLYAREYEGEELNTGIKDFDRILRKISVKDTFTKVKDLFKSFRT
jgi:cell division protein FtsA